MKKHGLNLQHLVQQFLKTSPRSQAQKRASILPPEYRPNLNKLQTDQGFVKDFIVYMNISYMYNYYGPPTVAERKRHLLQNSFVNPLSDGLMRINALEINDATVDKKTVLFRLIKGVKQDKCTVIRYTELQQFLLKLTIPQARQYKKFIVQLYKWLLNQKHTFTPYSIQHELCQETSEIIIKKIYEAHQAGDYEILKNTQEELQMIKLLEKAREMKKSEKMNGAREAYEHVYFGRFTEEVDRLEALQFIVEKSKEQLDAKFLQQMVAKINQGLGLKSHQKTLLRAISQIKDLETPLQQLANTVTKGEKSLKQNQSKESKESKEQKKSEDSKDFKESKENASKILMDEKESKEAHMQVKGKKRSREETTDGTNNS